MGGRQHGSNKRPTQTRSRVIGFRKLNRTQQQMTNTTNVTVMDINMSFGNMVNFMIKWAFASVIALIAVGAICAIPVLLLSWLGAHQ